MNELAVDRSVSVAAERIETIIDAAIRAASEIRAEAREEAVPRVDELARAMEEAMRKVAGDG
jgi:vacuolar-type H+-ATPase subunit H